MRSANATAMLPTILLPLLRALSAVPLDMQVHQPASSWRSLRHLKRDPLLAVVMCVVVGHCSQRDAGGRKGCTLQGATTRQRIHTACTTPQPLAPPAPQPPDNGRLAYCMYQGGRRGSAGIYATLQRKLRLTPGRDLLARTMGIQPRTP